MKKIIQFVIGCALVLTFNFITAPVLAADVACNSDVDCAKLKGNFLTCTGGICIENECLKDENCPARKRCTTQPNVTFSPLRCISVDCRADSDCPVPGRLTPGDAERVCINYACKQCRFDTQCRSRSCNEQTNICITCRSAADCPSNLTICSHGRCDNCRSDADCSKPGYCEEGLCKAGACRTATDCLAGFDCLNGRCAVQKTDLQKLLAKLSKLRRMVVQVPAGPGVPVTFDLREVGILINASGAVRSTIGLVILDKSGRPLVDLGRFKPTASGGISLPASFSGKTSGTIARTGDLCGFSIGVTDESGAIQGRIPVCLDVK